MDDYTKLMKLTRKTLNSMAEDLGIADPDQFENKSALAKQIVMMGDIQNDSPSVEVTVEVEPKPEPDAAELNLPVPDEEDEELIEVVVTGSHFGYNSKIYDHGKTLMVPPDVETKNRNISIPLPPEALKEVAKLKAENAELRRSLEK